MADGRLLGKRVLLVEDETLIAMMLEEVLADLGCEVIGPVGRLDAAKEMIEGGQMDCALIDVDLHGRPAYPLADLLDARGVPFGFVTGYEAQGLAPRFRRGHPVLQKPISREQVAAVLSAMTRPGRTRSAILRSRRRPPPAPKP